MVPLGRIMYSIYVYIHTDVCIFVCFYMCIKLFLYMHSGTMNTTYQESIKMTPYEAVFGQK